MTDGRAVRGPAPPGCSQPFPHPHLRPPPRPLPCKLRLENPTASQPRERSGQSVTAAPGVKPLNSPAPQGSLRAISSEPDWVIAQLGQKWGWGASFGASDLPQGLARFSIPSRWGHAHTGEVAPGGDRHPLCGWDPGVPGLALALWGEDPAGGPLSLLAINQALAGRLAVAQPNHPMARHS